MSFLRADFSHHFTWKGTTPLLVATITPASKKNISEGLKLLSSESVRNRFMGGKSDFSPEELSYLTELDGDKHFALGIEEDFRYRRGIGIIRVVRSDEDSTLAEVAITIIDEYQKMGLGTFLMDLVVLGAIERGIEKFSFHYLPRNDGIINLIKKYGNIIHGESSPDFQEMFLELSNVDMVLLKKRLAPYLGEIDTGYLKT